MASINDDEVKAGSMLMTNWKIEHQKTMWNDLTDKTISKTQLRLATIAVFVMVLFLIGIKVAEAYASDVSFYIVIMPVFFLWFYLSGQQVCHKNIHGRIKFQLQ